jgi:hypothetical protein
VSTILKALQQLEDEKREKPELTLEQQVAMPRATDATPGRGAWMLGGSAAVGMAAAVGVIYFWMGPNAATETESPVVAAVPTPPTTARPAPPTPKSPGPAGPVRSLREAGLQQARAAASAPQASSAFASKSLETAPSDKSNVEVVQRVSATRKAQPEQRPPPDLPERLAPPRPAGNPTQLTVSTRNVASARSTAPSRPAAAGAKPAATLETLSRERDVVPRSPTRPASSKPRERTRTGPTALARTTTASESAVKLPPDSRVARAEPVKAPPAPPRVNKPATGSAVERDHKVVLRAKLPELKVRSTVWHPQGTRRVALVEVDSGPAMELNEGDAVGPLVVESIKPGGVVFGHDGVSVLHKVGR